MTHLIDADQRAVSLRIVAKSSQSIRVRMPAASAVVPPGPYLLFVTRGAGTGLVPSVAKSVLVLGADATCSAAP
jgi:hypothetical protein